MRKISLLMSLLLLSSCEKSEHIIEIYTLKSRAKNIYGISAEKYFIDKEYRSKTPNKKNTTVDTIKMELIYAGEFLVDVNNLEKEPIIFDNEIKFLDIKKNQIEFSESAKEKLSKFIGNTKEGIQFVMTDNKKPIIHGYLWNDFSSSWSHWNCISYCTDYKKHNHPNRLFKGIGNENLFGKPIDFKNYKNLIKAFTESNRIKK